MIKPRLWFKAGVVLMLVALACAGTWKMTANHYVAVISKMETAAATAAAETEKAATEKLRAAQSLSDVLSSNLADAEHQINTLTLEKTREIHHYATGNICFNADLTQLLNQKFSDYTTTSETVSTPAAEDATVEAIETEPLSEAEPLTDTDLAQWIAYAQGQYETCRVRLGALIDFELQAK